MRAKVRVHVRALLGSMPELGLNCLDRVTVGDGLARYRMPTKRVMTQRSERSCSLHGHHGALGLALHNGQLLLQGEVLESELALRIQARSDGRE